MFDFTENPFDMKFSNRGRLSPKERKRMEFCLQAYHVQMVGVMETSRQTGINHRTVSKYFTTWNTDLLKSDNGSFIELCKITKSQRIHALDIDIVNYTESEREISDMIRIAFSQNNVKDYVLLCKSLDKIINSRQKLQDQKIELINTITFDVDITSEVKKFSKPAIDSNFDVIPLDIIPKVNEINNSSVDSICIKSDKKNHTVNKIHNNSRNNDSSENMSGRKLVP